MYDINLYIETTNKGPHVKDGHYIYVLEYVTSSGKTCTLSGRGHVEKASGKRMELTAILTAIQRINKPCEIRVFTKCEGILAPVRNGWLNTWKNNGFLTAKKEPVKNADLWQQLGELLERHLIHEEQSEHEYKQWMLAELKKEERKEVAHADSSG